MFISLKYKIIFFISLIIATTAAAMMYFTHRDVGHAMLGAEKASAQNVLRLVELNIQGRYKKLLSDKVEMIVRVQRELTNITAICVSILGEYNALFRKGLLSIEDAQERSLNWIDSARFEKVKVCVFGQDAQVIAHPDPTIQGMSIASLQDIKGRRIAEVMRDDVLKESGDSAVFFWRNLKAGNSSKKLGYFIPFPQWHWTVGAVIDFGEIEAENTKIMTKIIEVLETTLAKIQIGKTGYVFLFSGKGEMLIPPPGHRNQDYHLTKNVLTGNTLADDLMLAAQTEDHSIRYISSTARPEQLMEAHVRYVKAFDWYITVALPFEEINLPGKTLVTRQSFLIGMIFLVSLALAFVLVSRISRPLKILASYAEALPSHGFNGENEQQSPFEDRPTKFKDEVSRLSESFVFMKTELKKNIQELIEAEAKCRAILESIDEGFFETDLAGRFTYFNESICKIMDHNRNALLGAHGSAAITSEFFQKLQPIIEHVQRTGETAEIRDFHITRKDGAKRNLELSVYPIKGQSDQLSGFRGVVRDITERLRADGERKKLETQLLQVQKMEAIGTLAGGIAHDFANVLSAIVGYTELVLHDTPEENQTRENLIEVLNAAQRASDLVNQILTFSRQTEKEAKPIKVIPIVQETCRFLRASLPSTIDIRQNVETVSGIVLSDATKVHQVLMNLCTNAAHAMGEKGGVLGLSLTNVEIEPVDIPTYPDLNPGPYLKLSVSDTGHGMDRAVMERIFEPYFTSKEKSKGTGLGLSVVLGITRSYGGTVTVFSQPGKGTTFNVYLPRVEKPLSAEAPIARPLIKGRERILFVDDEDALVRLGKQMLERLGYEVTFETSSTAALAGFRENPSKFDLVITDMTMPRMTGMELAKELMNIRPDIPIILCSGYSELVTGESVTANGVREFVKKPLVMGELAMIIRRVLEK